MKIKKRHQPLDLSTVSGDGVNSPVHPEPGPPDEHAVEDLLEPVVSLETPLASPSSDLPEVPPTRTELRVPPVSAMAPQEPGLPPAWPIYLTALFVSVLWAAAPVAFAFGYRRAVSPFDFDPFALTVLAALAIGPAALVWVAAYAVRQGQKLGQQAQNARSLSDQMIAPAMVAGAQAADVVQMVREEIAATAALAEEARQTLLALRSALAAESEKLVEATLQSARTAETLITTLGHERTEMEGLAKTLDAQATAVSDTITQQARMVAEASDLAETQLREAEASLAARAADLAAAAGETSDAARIAGEDLTRHIARLETAGSGVADQISVVEQGLSEQRAGLVTVVHALRADQENFAAQAETNAAQLSEFIAQARLSALEMGDRAAKGGEALRALIIEAAEQFRELAESAKAERDEFGQSTLHALEDVSEAAAQQRALLESQTRAAITALAAAAEDTRKAAEAHATMARDQVDQLSEAAFTAGQTANSVFEARLAEARELIEQSAMMVEQAGAATARKLDEGAVSARATLSELSGLMSEIEAKAAELPTVARGQADQVREAVAQSLDELMDHARRTAEETQAIDAAFQERVQKNYEMLSEAIRLMGSAAGTGAVQASPRPAAARAAPALRGTLPVRPAPEAPQERQRLKLTPTATDDEFTSIFEAAAGRPPEPVPAADGWTWKDLLSSMDEGEPAAVADDAGLVTEIAGMGIDPAALLPRSRIEEIAAAIQTGDLDGAREVVRKLAPAATRRLTRRLFTDEALKRQVLPFVGRYLDLLEGAAESDPEGFGVADLLGSDLGRAYLLFDAAVGDVI
jgi:hypothetical protein